MSLTLTDIVLLMLGGLAINQWWLSRDAKTVALMYAAQRCQELDLQLLDQTIVLQKSRLRRSDSGWLQWRREYSFEFSSTGHERYKGRLTLAGHQLLGMEMDPHVTLQQ
ncbi:MAG TPA: DUF3301 domain-containing protein [Pseudohongiella sp.]|nr:DUF3301 domain-containing protein [Pseudohongiella sp.]